MAKLNAFLTALHRHRIIYVDTSIFIYHLENHPHMAPLTTALFESVERGRLRCHTTALTILELNVGPYAKGREDLALAYIALLKNFPHLSLHEMTIAIADLAARIRAETRIKSPDAIHLATAMTHGCHAIVGNDPALGRLPTLPYLHLNNYT